MSASRRQPIGGPVRLPAVADPTDSTQALPDILAPGLSVVFCGINPSLGAASAGHHFANGSNRFWRAIHLAGFSPGQIRPEDDRTLLQYGCGLTTALARPTARASELSREELAAAAVALERKIELYAPCCLAFLGKMALAAMTGAQHLAWGPQASPFGGAHTWVLPNPSGLNRAFNLDSLVVAYRELRAAVASIS